MNLLIIDLNSNTGRIAIARVENGAAHILSHRIWENERSHADVLVHNINGCLNEVSLTYQDITKIGIVNGPGSFTGIRIAISCAKALNFTLNVPVSCINSLHQWGAAVAIIHNNMPIFIAQDVRRNELAIQNFMANGAPIGEMQHILAADLQSHLPQGKFIIAGSGAVNITHTVTPNDTQLLQGLAHLTHNTEAAQDIAPFYIRSADAKLPKAQLTFSS